MTFTPIAPAKATTQAAAAGAAAEGARPVPPPLAVAPRRSAPCWPTSCCWRQGAACTRPPPLLTHLVREQTGALLASSPRELILVHQPAVLAFVPQPLLGGCVGHCSCPEPPAPVISTQLPAARCSSAGTRGFVGAALAARLPEEFRRDMQEQYPGARQLPYGFPGHAGACTHAAPSPCTTAPSAGQASPARLPCSSQHSVAPSNVHAAVTYPPSCRPVGGAVCGSAGARRPLLRPLLHLEDGQRKLRGYGTAACSSTCPCTARCVCVVVVVCVWGGGIRNWLGAICLVAGWRQRCRWPGRHAGAGASDACMPGGGAAAA